MDERNRRSGWGHHNGAGTEKGPRVKQACGGDSEADDGASQAAGVWSLAFRPFFLAAAVWAAPALAL